MTSRRSHQVLLMTVLLIFASGVAVQAQERAQPEKVEIQPQLLPQLQKAKPMPAAASQDHKLVLKKPDLVVAGVSTPVESAILPLTVTVKNQGSAKSDSTKLLVSCVRYGSPNVSKGPCLGLGMALFNLPVSPLEAGRSQNVTFSSPSPGGTTCHEATLCEVKVTVDPYWGVDELNESNNMRILMVLHPSIL